MAHHSPAPDARAEAILAAKPMCQRDEDAQIATRDWLRLFAIGAIPNRNPPAPPAVTAIRDANEALLARLFSRRG